MYRRRRGPGGSSTAFSNAVSAASIASCGRSRVMNTTRVRRSSLGHYGTSAGTAVVTVARASYIVGLTDGLGGDN